MKSDMGSSMMHKKAGLYLSALRSASQHSSV